MALIGRTRRAKAGAALRRFLQDDEDGATAIEYGLIAALMAVALIDAISSISEGLTGMYENVKSGLDSARG